MFTVKIHLEFSAAHIIRGYDGPCSRPHGHNWRVTVEARTEKLDRLGMSIDFYALEKCAKEIADRFDHRDMNTIPPFDAVNPTSENVAKYFYDELKRKLPTGILPHSVTVNETAAYAATYTED